jgi:AP-4 complex subunit epsilon-1
VLRARMREPDVPSKTMREYIVRALYCEMLGIDASFSYINAVKFTQSTNLLDKRVGYLACSLFLHRNHELLMLLVNTIQRDLKSPNVLEVRQRAHVCVCLCVRVSVCLCVSVSV